MKKLYEVIEHYMVEYAAVADGALVDDAQKACIAAELREHLTEGGVGARSFWTLRRFVPGVRPGDNVDDKDRLFNQENEAEMSFRDRDRRLASLHHSRYYFAFSKSAGALDDLELYSFISSAKRGEDVEHICLALIEERRPQGGTKFDLLIDRLDKCDEASLPGSAVPSILMALANSMDRAALEGGVGQWGMKWSWVAARRLCRKLAIKVSGDDRSRVIHDVFSSGKAIGWLMSEVVRGEIWAHGRVGDRTVPEQERLLSDKELNEAIRLLLDRFRSTERDKLVNTPDLLSVMYGWMEAGDKEGVLEWVQEQQATDAGFLALLSACRGWMQADKLYHPLNRRDLKKFLEFDNALGRLKRISEDTDGAEDERALAKELLEAAKVGRDC